MKKAIIIIGMMLFSVAMMAQGTVVNKYFEKYQDNENFTKVSVSQKMFSMFTDIEPGSPEEKDFLEAVSKLKGLKVLVADSVPDAMKIYKKAVADVDNAGYEELMSIKDADENLKFSILEKDGKIQELIMVMGSKKEFVMLSIYGDIDLKSISKIAQKMKVEGLNKLGKMDKDHDDDHEKDTD
ncbi:MAG: DUF4252 domain-containing protein [Chlorobi bacterium]|nr:DUF4252 domain-containing protein [Chlorobiota bacterium]